MAHRWRAPHSISPFRPTPAKPGSIIRTSEAPLPGPFLLVSMLPDLERLIRLQQLEIRIERARATIADGPERLSALDSQLALRQDAVTAAQARLEENHAARRSLEKDLAAAQGRLARFKDQLMEVKTNKEYQAMQKELAGAERETRSSEDQILELLLAGDELEGDVKRAERDLATERAADEEERRAIESKEQELEHEIARELVQRQHLVGELDPEALALYKQVARARRGVAVAEARAGHCSICNVRLRPQVFNEIRRNERVIQCESCQRILYFAAAGANAAQSLEPRNAE